MVPTTRLDLSIHLYPDKNSVLITEVAMTHEELFSYSAIKTFHTYRRITDGMFESQHFAMRWTSVRSLQRKAIILIS